MAEKIDPGLDLLKKQRFLEQERTPWDGGIWQDVADNFNTLRENMKGFDLEGKKQGTKLYDGTPVGALNLFADGLQGAVIPQSVPWFSQKLPRKFALLEDVPEIRIWTREMQEGMYSEYANSNFYSEMNPFIRDGASIIGTLTIEEDMVNGRLIFKARHPGEGYIAVNQFGEVDTYHRVFEITARQALQKFKDVTKFSQGLQSALENNSNPYKKFKFLQAISPRTDFDDRSLSNRKKRFASLTIEFPPANQSIGDTHPILKESGFDVFPVMTWRYVVSGSEVYPRTPCMFALSDAETLQVMAKSHTRAGEIAANPWMIIPAEQAGRVRTGPGGMNYIGDDMDRIPKAGVQGGNYPISIDREDKKRDMIEKHLHVDTFLMLQQAQRQMTAEEVRERTGEKNVVLSASIGNLYSTFDRVGDFVYIKGVEAGRIPPPPDILIEAMGGERLDTIYLGPFAQTQKRLFEKRGIQDGLESIAPLAEVYPEVLDEINAPRTARALLRADDFPETELNTPEEKKAIQGSRVAAAEQEAAKVDSERQSEVIKNLSQAKKNAGGDLGELAEQVAVQQ